MRWKQTVRAFDRTKLARYGTRLAYLFVRSGLSKTVLLWGTLLMQGRAAPLILIASFVAILYLSKTFFGRPPVASARLAAAMQTQFNEADVDASGAVSFDEYYRHFFGKRGAFPAAGATPASSPPPPPPPAQQQQQLVTSAGAVLGGSASSFDNSYMRLSAAGAEALQPPPPPPPRVLPPPPPPLPRIDRPFDNAFMRLGEQPRPQQQQQVPKGATAAAAAAAGSAKWWCGALSRLRTRTGASSQTTRRATHTTRRLRWWFAWLGDELQSGVGKCCEACKAHARTCGSADSKGKVYYTRMWEGKTTEERCPATMSSNELGTHPAERCNVFVYCPTPIAEGGLCWSNDVWNHTYGEVSVHEANARRPTVRPCARLFPSPSPCFQSTTTPIASSSSSEADRRRRALTPMSLARLRSQCWLKNQANPARPWAGAYGGYPAGYRKKHRTTPPLVQWMSGSLTDQPVRIDGPHWHW